MRNGVVDAIITDPPYGLTQNKKGGSGEKSLNLDNPAGRSRVTTGGGFMGQKWDAQVPGVEYWVEAYRVLKPGAYLLAFGGTRTFHRLTCAIEDAGFEIRDCMMWLYGSGFPKSLDVSKAIDKAAGADRVIVAQQKSVKRMIPGADQNKTGSWIKDNGREFIPAQSIPATAAAAAWQGWGTALKPAWEPIIIARKPLEGTVAENVQKWGTGAMNIDASRISKFNPGEFEKLQARSYTPRHDFTNGRLHHGSEYATKIIKSGMKDVGRWPANVILSHHSECDHVGYKTLKGSPTSKTFHGAYEGNGATKFLRGISHPGNQHADENGNERVEDWRCHPDCPVGLLDEMSGERTSGFYSGIRNTDKTRSIYGTFNGTKIENPHAGSTGGASRFFYTAKADRKDRGEGNDHPTVKPQAIIEYLLKFVSRPGALILDPFVGSGTTVLVADKMGRHAIGLDNDEKSPAKAHHRVFNDAPLLAGKV